MLAVSVTAVGSKYFITTVKKPSQHSTVSTSPHEYSTQ